MALLESARGAFLYCPIASRFIDTLDDCRSYYAHRVVGDRSVTLPGGATIVVRFGRDEIHPFTRVADVTSSAPLVGRARERHPRQFDVARARLLDRILPTVVAPVCSRTAKNGGVMLYGAPTIDGNTRRMCVVLAPDGQRPGLYFVRTAYAVSPKEFAQAMRSSSPAPWPPARGTRETTAGAAQKEKAPSPLRVEALRNMAHTRAAVSGVPSRTAPDRDRAENEPQSGGGCPSGQ